MTGEARRAEALRSEADEYAAAIEKVAGLFDVPVALLEVSLDEHERRERELVAGVERILSRCRADLLAAATREGDL